MRATDIHRRAATDEHGRTQNRSVFISVYLWPNTVGESVYASPAIANGTIYIRGVSHLFAIANTEKKR
jgi:hypothetical protein